MKLAIGEYEVEIKARNAKWREKANKEDTMSLLGDMAIAFMEASLYDQMQGLQTLSKCNKEKWEAIHNALEEAGYFKGM